MVLRHSSPFQRAKFVGVFLLLAFALASCQSEKKEQPPTETPEASNMNEEKTSETTAKEDAKAETAPEEKGAPELDAKPEAGGDQSAFDDCVAKCLQRNQMRAVGADQLQRDCEAECKGAQK